MKLIFIITLLALFYLVSGQSNSEKIILNQNNNSLNVISFSNSGLSIEINIGNFYKSLVSVDGQNYFAVSLSDEGIMSEKGDPELPKIVRSISIPNTSDAKATITSSEYLDFDIPIVPSKGSLPMNVNPDDIPYTFSSTYSKDEFYPKDIIKLGEPYLIRDVRGIALTIFPFAYNPVTQKLRIYTKIEVSVTFTGQNLKNSTSRTSNRKNNFFEPIFNNHFINYNNQSSLKSGNTIEEDGRMLIISADNFYNAMSPFVSHKIESGIPTQIVKMSSVGADTNDVYNYIKNNYDNDNSLTFVLLVGDENKIPTKVIWNDGSIGGSDPSYSLVSGSDNYPDVIIGRFSAATLDQVNTMVLRTINFENMSEQTWFHKGVGIGMTEISAFQKIRSIRERLLSSHYTNISELYDGSQGGEDAAGDPTVSDVRNAVNSGVSIINYAGHGSTTSWGTTDFSVADVYSLTNDNKCPIIFSTSCIVGNFTTSTECFTESWLRAKNSTTGNPTGALAFYGSSIIQDGGIGMNAQIKFNDLYATNSFSSFGALCFSATCYMMDFGGSGNNTTSGRMFKAWHIFGDPSLKVILYPCTDENTTIESPINGENKNYLASSTITASNMISNNARVHYGAFNSVKMTTGFKVDAGCHFYADLYGCNAELAKSARNIDNQFSSDSTNISFEAKSNDLSSIIKLHPNPTHNKLFVEGSKNFDALVFDLYGRKVRSLSKANGSIDFSSLNPGIYMLHLMSEGKTYIQKIVKQ
jgi:hypothetical protein